MEIVNGEEESEILLLQAKPIAERVVSGGPFVMNSQEEIQQAYVDYRRTTSVDGLGKRTKWFSLETRPFREVRNGKSSEDLRRLTMISILTRNRSSFRAYLAIAWPWLVAVGLMLAVSDPCMRMKLQMQTSYSTIKP